MSVEIRDSKLQEDRETSKVWKLKMFFAIIFITVHIEAWWAGLAEWGAGEQIGENEKSLCPRHEGIRGK